MYSIIAIYIIAFVLPSIILDILQIYHIKSYMKKPAVILSQNDYMIAANYALISRKLHIVENLIGLIALIAWCGFGISYLHSYLESFIENSFYIEWAMLMLFVAIGAIINIPTNLINYKIDKHFGFNKQSISAYILDYIKGAVLTAIVLAVLFWLLLLAMASFQFWWVVGFLITLVFLILAQVIYPTLIAPIFNKFTPLSNEGLRDRIHALMDKVGFQSSGIFVMDASKRDSRLNAYFGGLGRTKRVVLFDTLLDKISEDGLIAILGHELGHFKHGDIIRNMVIASAIVFCLFALVGVFCKDLCTILGLDSTHSNILIVALLFSPALTFIIQPISSYFSRKAEYRADRFGASCVSSKALSEALIRLVNENKSFPYSHPAYTFFYFSHPPLIDRLNALANYQGDSK